MDDADVDLNRPILDVEITVLDYESTGVVRGFENEPWQIGMVSLRGGRVAIDTQFESLLRVDDNRPFNPYAPGRHGQLRDEIAVALTPQGLWPKIRPRLTGFPLCAHNVATEKKFTRAMAPMHRLGPWIDTLRVARTVWPNGPSYSLGDLIVQFDLKGRMDRLCPGRDVHDALYDAVASALLLEHLFEQPGWDGVTLRALVEM